ncbi:hypothetical protein, partial [Bacillus cereus group sp. BC329]|uniref:hypothetical protein n=1 Tax=Bacillus cereus group sp. BC329 TaxID=3445307 RepID=UPI003F26FACF
GAASEAGQEYGQSSAEQLAQNVASQVYDSNRVYLEGVGVAGAQGALIGGVTGAGFSAALGRSNKAPAPAPPGAAPAEGPAASFEEVFGANGA